MSDDPIPCSDVEETPIHGYFDSEGHALTADEIIDRLSAWGKAERALADDLYAKFDQMVRRWEWDTGYSRSALPTEYDQSLARWREARGL